MDVSELRVHGWNVAFSVRSVLTQLELSAFCSSVITQRFLLSRTEARFRSLVAFVHGDRHKPQMSHQWARRAIFMSFPFLLLNFFKNCFASCHSLQIYNDSNPFMQLQFHTACSDIYEHGSVTVMSGLRFKKRPAVISPF